MKMVLAPLTLAVLLNLTPDSRALNAGIRAAKREVRIYLGSHLASDCGKDNLFCIEPVLRTVDGRSPALGALKALIAGPTADEQRKGLYAPYTEHLSIKKLVIAKGTARVSLRTNREGWQRWPGDMAPGRFTAAIEKTLKQFSNVRQVIICLDGYTDFASARDEPKTRCN